MPKKHTIQSDLPPALMDQLHHTLIADADGDAFEPITWSDIYEYLKKEHPRLPDRKCAYAAWYMAPRNVRQPRTKAEVARVLERAPLTLNKWEREPWFKELDLDRWRLDVYKSHISAVDRATLQAAANESGFVGIAARRLFYDQLERLRLRPRHVDGVEQNPLVQIFIPKKRELNDNE